MSARATDVLHQVDEVLPVLRERAQQAEDARAVPVDSIMLLREAGFFRLMHPVRYGSLEARPLDHFTADDDVGHGILHAHAGRIRELLLRLNHATTGHRHLPQRRRPPPRPRW